jgi:HNH endonuclease
MGGNLFQGVPPTPPMNLSSFFSTLYLLYSSASGGVAPLNCGATALQARRTSLTAVEVTRMDTPQEKICAGCHESKPLKDFRNDKYCSDGKSSKCRECKKKRDKELYDLHPEDGPARTAKWTAAHPEKRQAYEATHKEEKSARGRARYLVKKDVILAQNAQWYAEHKDERKISMAAWEAANKAKRKAQKAAQHLANPEAARARRAAWDAAHPGYGAIKWQRRTSRQAGAEIVDLSQAQWEEILERSNYRCCYCPDDCKDCKKKTHKFQQEHLEPVVRSGNYTVQNILPACPECNAKKGAGNVLKPVQPFLLTEAPPHVPKRRKTG